MIFGNKRMPSPLKLILEGNLLERTATTKFLGVYLDEKLNWNCHLNFVRNKISKGLGMLGRCRNILSNDILLTMYFSLIYPYLIYCCIVWGGASATALSKLQVLQNRAVRLITRSPFQSSADPLFKQLRLLKLTDIRKLQIVLFMYKSKNLLLPNSCLGYCLINNRISYNMRNSQDFLTPSFRTNIREQSISIWVPGCGN